MRGVSQALADYLLNRWTQAHGGLSNASSILFMMEEAERAAYLGTEEIICLTTSGMAYIGVLDKEGRVLYVTQEAGAQALRRGLPVWDDTTLNISPVLLLRLDAELTQTALAELAGCTQKDISRWETGARSPTAQSIERLKQAVARRKAPGCPGSI